MKVVWLRVLEFFETERKECANAIDFVDFVASCKKNFDGFSTEFLIFEDCLSASTARRDRLFDEIAIGESRYCEFTKAYARELSTGIENGGALGTSATRERRIFLVGASNGFAVFEKNGSPYMKVTIWSVGRMSGIFCKFDEIFIGFVKFVIRINLYLC